MHITVQPTYVRPLCVAPGPPSVRGSGQFLIHGALPHISPAAADSTLEAEPVESIETVSQTAPSPQTTAEAIAELLAAEQKDRPETQLVNFAPLHLLPGQRLSTRNRRGGPSLGRYRSMVNDLFKS